VKIFFDDSTVKESLWPLTATRNAADIRVGILTIREKWERLIALCYLNSNRLPDEAVIIVNASIIPSCQTIFSINADGNIAIENTDDSCKVIHYPWDIFQVNDWALRKDVELISTAAGAVNRIHELSASNTLIAPENIFIEAGASVTCSIINASTGPVYIAKNATVMEGCMIRGPFALCEGATLKMGAKIYGATTIGPYCIAAGEIKNAILFGYSNKAHDGYLGDSVIGEWCNFGAGTTNSNIKNTAGELRMWNNATKELTPVGTKGGLIMGDYSRTAINTSFNTGTVVGVCCNVFNQGFPPKLINSFTWGEERYVFEKAIQDIDNWKKLKGKTITEEEKIILNNLYNQNI